MKTEYYNVVAILIFSLFNNAKVACLFKLATFFLRKVAFDNPFLMQVKKEEGNGAFL